VAGRIVVFGATGYTGRLTAEALVARGARPVLAARNVERLRSLGDELGGLEIAVADVSRPESVRELVERGDVLISTVGPFARWGDAAAEAAIASGAHYLDSTGEPPFIRRVFEHFGPRAEQAGIGMVTAYFYVGRAKATGGTNASTAGAVFEPHFAWRDGRLQTERAARRLRRFDVGGRERPAVSVGSSEHFTLPRSYPQLREVDAYLGWFGSMSRPMQAMSAATEAVTKVPGVKGALEGLMARAVKGSTGGPSEEERAQSTSHVVATARDDGGRPLAEVRVGGLNGYDYTGRLLAWGAGVAAERGLNGAGALGPVEAFGVDELEAGSREAGIERIG
jgi:short subunit dehydrogenase-like uncharacterized protein